MQTRDDDAGSGDLFDHQQIRNYFAFVVGSVRRRKWRVGIVFAAIVGATIVALLTLPKTYHVEAKLFAQRNQVLAVRGDPQDGTAPTRGAVETVLRRDNLVALIQATDLVRHFQEHRAPASRLKGAIMQFVFRSETTEQDSIDSMVELLEKRLVVWTNEGTVSISIDWPDAQMAARLVNAAQQNFLETRYSQEITALVESIAIVRGHAASLTANIDEAVAGIEELRADKQAPDPGGAAKAAPAARKTTAAPRAIAPRRVAPAGPDLGPLKLAIDAKEKVIEDLEEARRHRLAEVQTRLVEARATYTDSHPVVIELLQTVASVSSPSPQVKSLRQELAALQADYDGQRHEQAGKTDSPVAAAPGDRAAPAPAAASTPPELPREIMRLDRELREDRDPATVFARGQLRDAMDKYAALRAQVQAAQIDLETAEAAFKYRYSVLSPAKVPKSPLKPNVPLVLFAAYLAAALCSILAAVIADLRAGRLVERWQIERILDRPILGEVRLPVLPRLPRHEPE